MTGGAVSTHAFHLHGGRVDLARVLFGGSPADWIDLSTGISPYGWEPRFDPADLTALPDPDRLAELEAAAGASFGAHPGLEVVAVPGSDLALRLIARLWDKGAVAVVGPGYSGHVAIWDLDRVRRITTDDIEDAAARHDILLLANPNNPDGRIVAASRLVAAADRLAPRSGWLIVDEAFADMAPDQSLAGTDLTNILILRSFGKFYGLPGLRLGFVLAPPVIAARLRAELGDWPVSGMAITIATAAYRDRDWQAAQRERLAEVRDRLDALLATAGLSVRGGTTLFRLIDTDDAGALFRHFAAHRILSRPFADDARALRIGLPGGEAGWTQLHNALRAWRR